jgi:hypothetical protein
MFEAPGRRGDPHHVKLIDKHCFLGANVANRLIEDAADEAGVIKDSKRPCTGTLIAMQLLTLAPKPVPASSPTATLPLPSTLKRSASSPIAVLLEPVVLLCMARSPNASFSVPVVLLKSASRP